MIPKANSWKSIAARMMTQRDESTAGTRKWVSSAPLKEKLTFVCYKEQSRQKEGEIFHLKPDIVSCSRISRRWISSPLKKRQSSGPDVDILMYTILLGSPFTSSPDCSPGLHSSSRRWTVDYREFLKSPAVQRRLQSKTDVSGESGSAMVGLWTAENS